MDKLESHIRRLIIEITAETAEEREQQIHKIWENLKSSGVFPTDEDMRYCQRYIAGEEGVEGLSRFILTKINEWPQPNKELKGQ